MTPPLTLSGATTAAVAEPIADAETYAVAIHEAAHAAVFMALSIPVERAAIGRAGGGFVFCERPDTAPDVRAPETIIAAWSYPWTPPDALPQGWSVSAYCIGALGGPLAWQRVTNGTEADRLAAGAYDYFVVEHLLARALGVQFYDPPVRLLVDCYTTAAAHHVTTQWPWIEAIAAALCDRGALTGDEVRALRPTPKGTTR